MHVSAEPPELLPAGHAEHDDAPMVLYELGRHAAAWASQAHGRAVKRRFLVRCRPMASAPRRRARTLNIPVHDVEPADEYVPAGQT